MLLLFEKTDHEPLSFGGHLRTELNGKRNKHARVLIVRQAASLKKIGGNVVNRVNKKG